MVSIFLNGCFDVYSPNVVISEYNGHGLFLMVIVAQVRNLRGEKDCGLLARLHIGNFLLS